MDTISQNAEVGRKAADEPYRERVQITIDPETLVWLKERSKKTRVPVSRIIDILVEEEKAREANRTQSDVR